MVRNFSVETRGQGLHEITRSIDSFVLDRGVAEGLCTVFVRHTSASLVIQENADPSAKRDLERWLARLAQTSVGIPILNGKLALGTWQGVFLWEHRRRGSRRELVLHIGR
jgi:thiamine phosphate synthase YjbQ (UPF0047 family)